MDDFADKRPGLSAALAALQPGDKLCVLEVDRLGRSLLDGVIVLNDLFERGVTVKVLEGIAAGEHCARSDFGFSPYACRRSPPGYFC